MQTKFIVILFLLILSCSDKSISTQIKPYVLSGTMVNMFASDVSIIGDTTPLITYTPIDSFYIYYGNPCNFTDTTVIHTDSTGYFKDTLKQSGFWLSIYGQSCALRHFSFDSTINNTLNISDTFSAGFFFPCVPCTSSIKS